MSGVNGSLVAPINGAPVQTDEIDNQPDNTENSVTTENVEATEDSENPESRRSYKGVEKAPLKGQWQSVIETRRGRSLYGSNIAIEEHLYFGSVQQYVRLFAKAGVTPTKAMDALKLQVTDNPGIVLQDPRGPFKKSLYADTTYLRRLYDWLVRENHLKPGHKKLADLLNREFANADAWQKDPDQPFALRRRLVYEDNLTEPEEQEPCGQSATSGIEARLSRLENRAWDYPPLENDTRREAICVIVDNYAKKNNLPPELVHGRIAEINQLVGKDRFAMPKLTANRDDVVVERAIQLHKGDNKPTKETLSKIAYMEAYDDLHKTQVLKDLHVVALFILAEDVVWTKNFGPAIAAYAKKAELVAMGGQVTTATVT